MAKTLEQLKAENEANEAIEKPPVEQSQEEETPPEIEQPEQSQEQESNGEVDSKPQEEVEAWMADESDEGNGDKSVPLSSHIEMRQSLKGKLREQNDELEALRAENEELMKLAQNRSQPQQEVSEKMPTLEDCDWDEARHQEAVTQWIDRRVQSQVSNSHLSASEQGKIEEAKNRQNQAVESHYERAGKLVSDNGIDPELYKQADLSVRQTIESVLPNMGDSVTDALISRMGNGSEKVMYYIGRNDAAKMELRSKLQNDPSGIEAAIYVGQLVSKVTLPKKRESNAPKPPSEVNGDATGNTVSANKLQKDYEKASKAGDVQEAFRIRREAKKLGIKVS